MKNRGGETSMNLFDILFGGNKKHKSSGKSMPILEEKRGEVFLEKIWYRKAYAFLKSRQNIFFTGEKLAEALRAESKEEERYYRDFSPNSGGQCEGSERIEFSFENKKVYFRYL